MQPRPDYGLGVSYLQMKVLETVHMVLPRNEPVQGFLLDLFVAHRPLLPSYM